MDLSMHPMAFLRYLFSEAHNRCLLGSDADQCIHTQLSLLAGQAAGTIAGYECSFSLQAESRSVSWDYAA